MKKVICASALAVACVGGMAPPAQADTESCVTRGEYNAVHNGMAKRKVHRIFDVSGRRTQFVKIGPVSTEIRRYRGCPSGSNVSIAYGNGRLKTKSASW